MPPLLRNLTYITRIIAVLLSCRFIVAPRNRGKYLAKAFEKLGPSFIKLGQALSVRPDIVGENIAVALSSLQDKMPPFDTKRAISTIEKELERKLEDMFTEFDSKPVAAASIAQVHKAVTKEGNVVAVKILRPNIEKQFQRDLALFYFLARILNRFASCKRLKPISVVDVFAQTVKKELDLRLEAASAQQIRENCKNDSGIYVPQIYWQYTQRRVLVIEWVDGTTINDTKSLLSAGHDLKLISENLAIFFLNQAFRDGFFHADIHPGNLFIDKNGNIVPIDFGIMGWLDHPTRIYVAEILRGFLLGDYMRVAQMHFAAGYVAPDQSIHDFALACRAIGQPITGLPANQVSIAKLLAMLFKVTEDFNMQTQPQLLLLQKTMMLIEGVGMQLYPQVNMWQMAESWIGNWASNNLGAKARVKAGLQDLYLLLQNLPERLKQLDKIIETFGK